MIYSVGHSTLSKEEFARLFSGIEQPIVVDVRSHPTSRWPQFQKRELETWLPGFGIGYEWQPALGGWREKHTRWYVDFAEVGVDISAYIKGVFPKHRIGKSWKYAGLDPQCPLHGKEPVSGLPVGEEPTVDLRSLLYKRPAEPDSDVVQCACGAYAKSHPSLAREYQIQSHPTWQSVGLWDYQWYMVLGEFLAAADRLITRSKTENLAIMCCELLPWKCHRSMVADFLAYRGIECIHLQPKLKSHYGMLGNRLDRYHPEVKESWDLWTSGPKKDQ